MTVFSVAILRQRIRQQAEILSYSERDERGMKTGKRWEDRTPEDQARWVNAVDEGRLYEWMDGRNRA